MPDNSATQGFGSEAIGRQTGFADRVLDLLGQVPIVRDIAIAITDKLGWDRDEWVPRFSLIIIAFIIAMLPAIIKNILRIWFIFARLGTRGSGANARMATFSEIFRNYTIPTRLSGFAASYALALTIVGGFYWALSIRHNYAMMWIIAAGLAGFFYWFSGPYSATLRKVQPFPLGRYGLLKLFLTGGQRSSIIRGTVSEQRESHVIIIGPSGSGKTSRYFIPGILMDAFNHCSVVVIEAKASEQEDLFKLIAPTWCAQKKKVILFDPWGKESVSFNPLLNLKPSFDDPETRDTVDDIIGAIYATYETEKGRISGDATYHSENEKRLLKGLILLSLFKPKGQRNLATICEVAGGSLESVVQYINSSINLSKSGQQIAQDIRRHLEWFTNMDNGDPRLKAAMLQGLHAKLSIFSHPRVKRCVVNNELDLDIVFKEPTLFTIKAPLNVEGASTIASIIIRLLIKKVPKKLSYGAGADFKTYFYLDELPSLAIPKFDEFTKTARSAGVGIIAAIQDRPDMAMALRHAPLGIHSVDAILANFKTQIILAGVQATTAEYYSKRFGKTEVKTRRNVRNTESALDFGWITQREEKLLLHPDTISYIDKHMCLIADQNVRPFFVYSPYYKDRGFERIWKKYENFPITIYRDPSAENVEYEAPQTGTYPLTSSVKVSKENQRFSELEQAAAGSISAPIFAPGDLEYAGASSGGQKTSDAAEDNSVVHKDPFLHLPHPGDPLDADSI